ncbi:MAG: beta-galactosidase trimerization domain-containing protein [Chthoniobacteraceae bacterium]|nr:beta-galactosidase trimerization domain-containing protein [Chthoniobacteraceae bacterium]
MKPKSLRFRQIHLDFHTSPAIEGIGAAFDKKEWQETLQTARVDSITLFSKCHHGLSYHPTTVGVQHPHLTFDLLRTQMDACREIGVRTPVYLSAGVDNTITRTHPEWREIDSAGRYAGWSKSPLEPGFHKLCFNTPYLDYLCRQIEETVTLFPDADGIFLDIIAQGQCCCPWCMEAMAKRGLDPLKEEDRVESARLALERYYQATTAACKIRNPGMPVFHNSGNIARNNRDILQYESHLELESLPTGGWGYDHFPESAAYAANLGLDFLGMTGKFHLSWGEFGGLKHPNALRYECAAMLAVGAKCSIGDQLHPSGRLDRSTYAVIGAAYGEVAAKEPWCSGSAPIADIAILSSESENGQSAASKDADTGACRILLEGHHLFTLIDRQIDFAPYKLLILPDNILVDDALRARLDAYLAQGGKLLLSGRSGLRKGGEGFALDIGASYQGESPYSPDYLLPAPALRPPFLETPLLMYAASQRIQATTGESLGQIFDPYFNRTYQHFCSHRNTPFRPEPSGFDAGVRHGGLVYLAHPVFTLYRGIGAVIQKDIVLRVLDTLLGDGRTIQTNLPSTARVTVRQQPEAKRRIVHLLYANKAVRGGEATREGGGASSVEVIEDLAALHGVTLSVRQQAPIARVTIEPQGEEIPHTVREGRVEITLDTFTCHQMVVLHEAR